MKIPANHQCTDCRGLLLSEASHFGESRSEPLCHACYSRRFPPDAEEQRSQRESEARMHLGRAFREMEGIRAFRPELEAEVQAIQLRMIDLRRSLDVRGRVGRRR